MIGNLFQNLDLHSIKIYEHGMNFESISIHSLTDNKFLTWGEAKAEYFARDVDHLRVITLREGVRLIVTCSMMRVTCQQ